MGKKKAADKASRVSILRAVLFGILLVFAILLIMDRRERNAAQAAADLLEARMPGEEDLAATTTGTPTIDEVHELLGREPDAPASRQGQLMVEEYTWSSPVRSYKLYIAYRSNSVAQISLNRPLDDPGD